MDMRRLRGPLLAAIGTILLAGGSVALATDPSSPAVSAGTTAEQPENGGSDNDNVQEEVENESGADENDADDPAEADKDASDNDNVQDEVENESGADENDADDAADADAPDADNVEEESGASD